VSVCICASLSLCMCVHAQFESLVPIVVAVVDIDRLGHGGEHAADHERHIDVLGAKIERDNGHMSKDHRRQQLARLLLLGLA
jgi:hypothetical protein